ncbi:MAG TPA: SDR family NAD(P)-dependent oxidoreductase [Rhodanobacteraceae bacterium]|nr:SDR family NAD(P)-dependent oxidoreductase [Rhodanobacteraceae bacterium]
MMRSGDRGRHAIVGIGCRLPGGVESPAAFWQLLTEGRDAIVEVPADRPDWQRLFDPDPSAVGRIHARVGGFIDGIDRFDARFFGISPREAMRIDPQQRLLLEVVWHAFEDANIPIGDLAGTDTGVFVGISTHDYADVQMYPENRDAIDAHSNTGGATSIAANRVSYLYDFRGPSLAVDTACSSALTAVHLACRALDAGDCGVAVAGGVQLLLRPELTVGFCRATMLSVDGRCKAFDTAGNGYVRSEGAGVVVLKPLARALADGDAIYAVILGSAINQDGHSSGLTVPNQASQQAMLRAALLRADVQPRDVHYVEAHGTGTAVGDPIEARAIGTVFGEARSDEDALWIGSVKTNIGHLEAASGIAGLIKTALSLHHRRIPPSLHFLRWNPAIDAAALKIRVATELLDWPGGGEHALAAVSSFGFGGANASAVLAAGPAPPSTTGVGDGTQAQLLTLSARSGGALRELALDQARRLRTEPSAIAAVCGAAALGRSHLVQRVAVVGTSRDALADALESFASGESAANIATGTAAADGTPGPVFVFSGMGPQWWAMGRQLLADEPVFAAMLERCDAALRPLSGWSLLDEFRADEATSRLAHPQLAQVSNFALQIALAELWRAWGVRPAATIGHSGGAMAAAFIAGVHSLEDAIGLAFHRSRLQGRPTNAGAMLAIGLPSSEAPELLRGMESRVSLAAVNAPNAMTLAGDPDALAAIAKRLTERKVFARMLPVTIAYHSPAMDPIRDEFLALVANLRGAQATMPLVSDTTGAWISGPGCDAAYWWNAIRLPVLFAQGMDTLLDAGHTRFLELSPHPVLAVSIGECLAARAIKGLVVPSLRRGEDERTSLLRALASLHVNGVDVRFQSLYRREAGVALPLYRWQRERHWFEPAAAGVGADSIPVANDPHPLLRRRVETAHPTWEARLDEPHLDYLDDHLIDGTAVFPGAGYVEMALAAARRLEPDGEIALRDVEFLRPLVLADRKGLRIQIAIDPDDARFDIHAGAATEAAGWARYARGRISRGAGSRAPACDAEAIRTRLDAACGPDDFYAGLHQRGLHYGERFRGIRALHVGARDALAVIGPVATLRAETHGVHPALLDACFQLLAAVAGAGAHDERLFLPTGIDEIRLYRSAGPTFLARCRLESASESGVTGSIELLDLSGTPILSVRGLHARFVDSPYARTDAIDECLYEYRWEPQPIDAAARCLPRRSVLPADLSSWRARMGVEIQRIERETDWPRYYRTVEPLLSGVAAAHVQAAFSTLGLFDDSKSRLTRAALDTLKAREPSGGLWTERLLALLLQTGTLRPGPDGWTLQRSPPRAIDADALNGYETDLALLAEAGRTLPDALLGRGSGQDAAFTASALPLLTRFYGDAPASAFYNRVLANALCGLAAQANRHGCLRVLEVGAGTGGTTGFLLEVLPCARLQYLCTDSAALLVDGLRERFGHLPFVHARILDLTLDPVAQGFAPASFDLVIAANVVHATPDIMATLQRLRTLLAPAGTLALIEITRRPYWLDVIFGQTRGWWGFADRSLRPDQPLLPSSSWIEILREAGFDDVVASCEPDSPGEAAQTVLLAVAPGIAPAGGNWLILGSGSALEESIRIGLESLGHAGLMAPAGTAAVALDTTPVGAGVVLVLQPEADDGCAGPAFRNTQLALDVMQAVLARPDRFDVGLWIVTTGAAHFDGDVSDDVLQAPVWGLARSLLKERPELFLRLVDLGTRPASAEVEALLREMIGRDTEEEVALRGDLRAVRRLRRTATATLPARTRYGRGAGQAWRAGIGLRGSLASLRFTAFEPRALAGDELRIDVRAASLNFRDVMLAMGAIAGLEDGLSFGGRQIGSDCAGVVTEVGSEVTRFRVGDGVMAMAAGSLGSCVIAPDSLVCAKPVALSFEESASLPTAFLTAWYALVHLARLQPGERVLIHSATGGVGLAAVQVARFVGARIFATAGSAAKREHLAALGIEHVMDSRSLAFADEIREHTDGQGVDIVLNSLAGEAIGRGIACLAPYGRFVEIGKRDIYENRDLSLAPFRQNLSFLAVDLDRLCAERPLVIRTMLQELAPHFASGTLAPVPLQCFDMPHIEDAFRLMAQARHIGKIVLTRAASGDPPALHAVGSGPWIRADASYLVSGGLGGFGLEVAQWLAERGAGAIVLMGRHAPTEAVRQRLAAIGERGIRVEVMLGDVGRPQDVDATMDRIDRTLPPLRGIFHAAMVLDDRGFEAIDTQSLERVLAPKARGAWLLHQRTQRRELDLFVLFSSIASLLGNPMQANYSAASAFLDAVSHHRRATGFPALTINWGVLAGAGYVAARPELEAFLDQQGYRAFPVRQALRVLDAVLAADVPELMVARIDWRRLADYSPRAAASPRIADLVPSGQDGVSKPVPISDILGRLASAPAAERAPLLESHLRSALARVLGLAAADIDSERPIDQLGLDSLLAVEFMMVLTRELGVELPVIALLGGMTIARLTGLVLVEIKFPDGSAPLPRVETAMATEIPASLQPAHETPVEKSAPADAPAPPAPTLQASVVDYASLDYSRWSPLQRLARRISRIGFSCFGDIRISGLENLPQDGPYILAVNHLSMADVPLALTVLPRRAIILATAKLKKSRILDWLVADVGQAIYVQPNEESGASLKHALDVLANGGVVALAPEGTRSRSGLLRGQTGVSWLAQRAQVPVIPYVAWGQEQWRTRFRRWSRVPVHVRIGSPVPMPTEVPAGTRATEHTKRIMIALAHLLPPDYRGVYAAAPDPESSDRSTA